MALTRNTYLTASLVITALIVAGCTTIGRNGAGRPPTTIMPVPGSSEVITQSTLMPPRAQFEQAINGDGTFDDGANPNIAATNNPIDNKTINAIDNAETLGQNSDNTTIAGLSIPSSALDLSPAMVAGVWHASVDGMVCQFATPQTKYGKGFRAAPLRCPASFMGITSWSVLGKQLNLYNDTGTLIAALYGLGTNMFEGQTNEGQIVTLNR